MKTIAILMLFAAAGSSLIYCQTKKKAPTYQDKFYAEQGVLFDAHSKELEKAGRLPSDFGMIESIIGQYGWHSSDGESKSPGASAPLWLLQSGARAGGGSFGAYSFYQPAFDQAKRSWWIHGVMQKGSELLYPMNSNAKFDASIVGYKVDFMYKGVENATVLELLKYSDGSSMNVLRLDKRSLEFSRQWRMSILPQNYENMCACTAGGSK